MRDGARQDDGRTLTRREFMRISSGATGGAVIAPFVLTLAGCSGDGATDASKVAPPEDAGTTPTVAAAEDVLLGLYGDAQAATGADAVRAACKQLDFAWLSAGDSVLVKIACNSGNAHPAVTSPEAVRGMVAELFARGASRVVVADQSGVQAVRLIAGDQRFGSTRALMEKNGLYAAIVESGAEPHFFDDQGWDTGYFEATLPAGSRWTKPLWLPGIVREVDHIVYLPRLSSHAVCGYTHGHKMAMGWLRDDSRNHVHHDAATIYEKYVEISYTTEIRERFRLALTLAESVLLDFGPDTGTLALADPRIVVASQTLAHHDAVAIGVLLHVDDVTPEGPGLSYSAGLCDLVNRTFLTSVVKSSTGLDWGPDGAAGYTPIQPSRFEDGIDADRVLTRAFELRGGRPPSVKLRLDGQTIDPALRDRLLTHAQGLLAIA